MSLSDVLAGQLRDLDSRHLRRELAEVEAIEGVWVVQGGRRLLQFASNDYLGLARHPALIAAAQSATDRFGAGATASRLICGSMSPHDELEAELAAFKRAGGVVSFASGFAAAMGTIPALVGAGDYVLLDRLSHACLVDGARLSGARLRVFRHNQPGDLERLLRWTDERRVVEGTGRRARVLVVTESVFSMDGDRAPLREMVELKERHEAWLMVDEAHATGILGPERRGWIDELGLTGRVEVVMGTLGKAVGAAGGFIAGHEVLRRFLIHRGRTFLFSTAPPPGVAAAACAGVRLIRGREGEERAARLWLRLEELQAGLRAAGWAMGPVESPIVPLMVGAEDQAVRLAAALREEGVLVPAIRHPTVPRGKARLRLSVSAAHGADEVQRLLAALERATRRAGVRPS